MSYNLIIRLEKDIDPNTIQWALWDRDSKSIPQQGLGLSDELRSLFRGAHEIFVITPAVDIFITQVKMPKLSMTKLAKAMVFSLEDKLSEDPSLLHFAVGKQKKDGYVSVAVINKNKMGAYQTFLKAELGEAYPKIFSFIPEMLAIPWEGESFSVLVLSDSVLLRTDAQLGFLLERETLLPTLELLLTQSSNPPKSIKIYLHDKEELSIADQVKDVPVEKILTQESNIALMTETVEKPLWPIDLLQGSYGTRQISKSLERLLWIAFGLVSFWLIMSTFFGLTQYMLLTREKKAQREELVSLYAVIHPNTPLPSDPKESLQKELSNLRQTTSGTTFLRLINALGQEISSSPDIEGKTIKYSKNRVEVMLDVKSLEPLEALKKRLESKGYKIQISNAQRGQAGLIGVSIIAEEIR